MSVPGAVVIGGYVNALGVVRALAARGVRCAVVTTKPHDIAQRSRWVVGSRAVKDLDERADGLVEVLEREAPNWKGWALVPTTDEALAALREHGERLSSNHRIVAPSPDAIRQLLDKRLMMQAARAAGADPPHCYGPAEAATAERDDLRFPLVVKPLVAPRFVSHFRSKVGVARDRRELAWWISAMGRAQISGLVMDLIPGPDSSIYAHCAYLDQSGAPVAGRLVRKLRQTPPGFGDARVAEVVDELPDLREATVEIARQMGLRGIVSAEFKRDARDGRFRFFEINGRSMIYNGLLRRAGLDLAGLAWDDQMGDGRPTTGPDWRGVWIHLHPDVLRSTFENRRGSMGFAEFVGPYRRPKVEAVWSSRDPMPFAAEWSRSLSEGVRVLRSGNGAKLFEARTSPPPAALS